MVNDVPANSLPRVRTLKLLDNMHTLESSE